VWSRLRDIVRRTAVQPRNDVMRGFRDVVFLGAGDALAAIDAVAPTVDLDFSADGLRRLAKSLEPDLTSASTVTGPFFDSRPVVSEFGHRCFRVSGLRRQRLQR
jgi:hypothetical protein